MSLGEKISLYFHTVKYLKLVQAFGGLNIDFLNITLHSSQI